MKNPKKNNSKSLSFEIISISSIEQFQKNSTNPSGQFPNLLKKGGTPWTSDFFCEYPQKIILKFLYPVFLNYMHILSHSKKISKRIHFYYYLPEGDDNDINIIKKNKFQIPFKRLGFVNLKNNFQCDYNVREFKKIFLNIKCQYLKIELENNYINEYNRFQQVSLINIECFGKVLNNEINIENKDLIDINVEKILKEVCPDTYDNLQRFLNNKNNEEYIDYEEVEARMEEIMDMGKKIYKVDLLIKDAANKNDFDKAIELKNKKEKLKYRLKMKGLKINKLYKYEFDNNFDIKYSKNYIIQNNNNKNIIDKTLNINNNIDKTLNKNINNENNNKISNSNSKENIFNIENENSLINNNTFIEYDSKNATIDSTLASPSPKKKKIGKNNSNIITPVKSILLKKLNTSEELEKKILKNYETLLSVINQDAIKNLLSKKISDKLQGFKDIGLNIDKILSVEKLKNAIIELINLLGIVLEDKNIFFIKQVSEIFEKVFNKISTEESIKSDEILKNLINKNIMKKLRGYLGTGGELVKYEEKALNEENIEKIIKLDKPTQIYLFILDKDILNIDILIKDLLKDDIKDIYETKNNNLQRIKVYSKLVILQRIFLNLEDKIHKNLTSLESFPKELIADYILLNIKSNDFAIKKLLNEIIIIYNEFFSLDIIKKNAIFYINNRDELKKILKQVPSLKPLLNMKLFSKNNSQFNLFKPIKRINYKIKSLNKNQSSINILKKNAQKNNILCIYCKQNIGTGGMETHIFECKMYTNCDGCNENILVENLNEHKLNFCSNKKKFKQCNKCKQAINKDIYDSHIKNNECNPVIMNMNRCPFCHHDIEKNENSFYQHLIIDGCENHTRH